MGTNVLCLQDSVNWFSTKKKWIQTARRAGKGGHNSPLLKWASPCKSSVIPIGLKGGEVEAMIIKGKGEKTILLNPWFTKSSYNGLGSTSLPAIIMGLCPVMILWTLMTDLGPQMLRIYWLILLKMSTHNAWSHWNRWITQISCFGYPSTLSAAVIVNLGPFFKLWTLMADLEP